MWHTHKKKLKLLPIGSVIGKPIIKDTIYINPVNIQTFSNVVRFHIFNQKYYSLKKKKTLFLSNIYLVLFIKLNLLTFLAQNSKMKNTMALINTPITHERLRRYSKF